MNLVGNMPLACIIRDVKTYMNTLYCRLQCFKLHLNYSSFPSSSTYIYFFCGIDLYTNSERQAKCDNVPFFEREKSAVMKKR